ncbi:MAG: FimV/HubP family polar landmark protein, partial [Gammaproteobacteria bacterium]
MQSSAPSGPLVWENPVWEGVVWNSRALSGTAKQRDEVMPKPPRVRRSRAIPGIARVLCASLAAASALITSGAHGVGLGEIRANSGLNETLKADIPLLDVAGLSGADLRVRLAEPAEFERIGVEPDAVLADFRFDLDLETAEPRVRVRSSRPVTEPFVNFLAVFEWPQGRLLKEYTLLLDPPAYDDPLSTPVRTPVATSMDGAEYGSGTEAGSGSGTEAGTAPASGVAEVRSGTSTLWRIATDHRPSRAVTVQQTMLAIQRLNPDAFINGNINLLRANQTLRLPSVDEATALSADEAAAQVARQSEQWRSPAPIPSDTPAPVDAGEQPARVPPIATRDANGRVEIIAGQADTAVESATRPSSTETTAAANAAGIGAPTTAALEETDRLSREVVELRAALDAQAELARNQLEKRDRQLALLDQRVAELQAEIDRLRAAGPEAVNQQRADSGWQSSAGVVAAGLGAVVLVLAGLLLRSRRTNSNI